MLQQTLNNPEAIVFAQWLLETGGESGHVAWPVMVEAVGSWGPCRADSGGVVTLSSPRRDSSMAMPLPGVVAMQG